MNEYMEPLKTTISNQDKKIEEHTVKICKQFIWIDRLDKQVKTHDDSLRENDAEIEALYKRISDLETRLESQEQYSRRTSLRFHNIRVPTDAEGRIIHPVNTDEIIINLCHEKLGLELSQNDIGRSHVIGKVRNGKSQVIVRFISYRVRNMVFSNKKLLKDHEDGVFITENLTTFRSSLTKRLSQLKSDNRIYTYWTLDGRIFVKVTEGSRKKIVNNFDDIAAIERQTRPLLDEQTPPEDVSQR